jgi:hypothetical protein
MRNAPTEASFRDCTEWAGNGAAIGAHHLPTTDAAPRTANEQDPDDEECHSHHRSPWSRPG